MGDLLSFLYTVVDSLSLILFLDVFAERRWSDRKFTIGVGCFVALNFWILKVPLIFFHRNQAIKIGMILLSYTFSARVLYTKISGKLLLLLVGVEYLITYSLSFGLGMLGAFVCGMDGESFRSSFPLMIVYGVINYSTELFLAYLFRKLMKQKNLPRARNRLKEPQLSLYFLFPCTSFFMLVILLYITTGKPVGEAVVAFTCGLILAANAALLYLLDRMERAIETKENLLALGQQIQLQAKNMEAASRLYAEQRHKVHTIHTHRGGEHCGVVLAARVEFRHSIYQGTKGYATTIVAYFGSEVVVYVHLNAFAKPLVKLVDTIVYTLLEQHIYTIFGMRAIAQATNVHAGTRTYVLGILKMSYFALVINDGRSILVLHCLVMFMADPLTH